MKEKLKTFFLNNWSFSEKCLLIADVFLLGVLIGWLTSPLKNGIGFFSNNTWDINSTIKEEEKEEEE